MPCIGSLECNDRPSKDRLACDVVTHDNGSGRSQRALLRSGLLMKSLWVWPFELEEKVGEGGMGVVYRGRYVKNDRRVAVKLLPEDVADETILARFEREVEILKTLKHPNIVRCFGGVCEDKRRFYAMELVSGGTLEDLLKARGGRLPWEQVVEIGLQICSALEYAHERGVVHRDIKPGNFLLSEDEQVKLSDFGLATVVSANKLTASGKTVGSFRYMAPEQVRGAEPVPQTDLYALGCLLYQMVVGRPPFDGSTAAELLKKQLEEPAPRLSTLTADCPVDLERLIHTLLEKSIDSRPASASDVAASLRSITLTTKAGMPAIGGGMIRQHVADAIPQALRRVPEVRTARPWIALSALAGIVLLLIACGSLWSRNQHLNRAEQLWIETFQDGTPETRARAADALGELAAEDARALAVLEDGLESDDPRVREAAVRGLARAGGSAKSVLSKVISLQRKDEDSQVRVAAAAAARTIREASDPALPLLRIAFWCILGLAAIGCAVFVWRRRPSREPLAAKPA